jgi:PAS domain S-box-containing protein
MSTPQADPASVGAAPAPSEPQPTARASILLVDDQPARLLSYEAILYGLGVQCVRALSGAQALERLLEQEFAAILLDVNMPEMDGFEVARLVREHPRMERTPIIFVTAVNVSELDRLKGYELGAIDYIAVPVVPEILRGKVAVLVELYERRGQLQTVNAALSAARAKLAVEHEQALAERDAQLQAIFEHPSDMTVVLKAERDASGAIADWIYARANRNAAALLGLPPERIVGRRLSEIVPERAAAAAAEHCKRVLEQGEPVRYESQFADRNIVITMFAAGTDCVVSTGQDVTKERRLQAQLEDTDRRKDEFLAMLAHELRNPVAPIANAAELLSRLVQHEGQRALVGIVQRQSVHLARLLDDLLDVARITQGRIELQREVIEVGACLQLAIETAEPLIRSKGHRLTITQPFGSIYVSADKARFGQCLANVLVNAAKYTPDGGEICVRSYADRTEVVVEISDNGIGIAPEFLPRIFDLFTQAERGLDRSQGGLGVGLTVCKQVIEMHGGSIEASSPGWGRGSTFTFRLPVAERPASAAAPSPAQPDAPLRVLIVDDNHDAADSLSMLLQFEGHRTLCAYSGEHALQEIAAFDPQIVLLDIGLPGLDGYEVARRLKALAPGLRVIALSGYGQPEDRQRSAAAGFDAHLIKPVDLDALKQVFGRS